MKTASINNGSVLRFLIMDKEGVSLGLLSNDIVSLVEVSSCEGFVTLRLGLGLLGDKVVEFE
jgi:hypothetical protein